jgi:hypothetical protein
MSEEKGQGPLFPLSGVIVLLAALGVITFTSVPFKGSRPSVPEVREPSEKVRARLWQDPFLAVLDHAKAHEGGEGKAGQFGLLDKGLNRMKANGSLAKQIKERSEKGKVTVLGVMEFGAPYAEETEMRIRSRYAVLSGLRRSGFVPEDPEHVDFITVAAGADKNPGKVSLSNIMPFEWLTKPERDSKSRNDSVLVLWINDDVFQEMPLDKLARLAECLELKDEKSRGFPDGISFKVIGPAGSTTLGKMLEEANRDYGRQGKPPAAGIEIYSAMATVDGSQLLRDLGEKASHTEADGKIEEKFRSHGIEFRRMIGSDRILADKLVHELKLRRVDLNSGKAHVVLVAEWDTFYGRSLSEIYKEVLIDKGADKAAVEERLHRFSYLRGLDGSLPGEKEDREGDKAQTKSNAEETIKRLEQPMGKSQYDYLRRLAEEIYRLDRQLQVKDEGSIKAIGVLGSDFHDKYLVLQALRQRFPDAVFFTTDLDARLLHPDKIMWTRNLVVASNFNLALRDELQHDVPPQSFSRFCMHSAQRNRWRR